MNTRPGFAPPNPEVEETVEVPAVGVHVVEDGDVHEVRMAGARARSCWCADDRHVEDHYGIGEQHTVVEQMFVMAVRA